MAKALRKPVRSESERRRPDRFSKAISEEPGGGRRLMAKACGNLSGLRAGRWRPTGFNDQAVRSVEGIGGWRQRFCGNLSGLGLHARAPGPEQRQGQQDHRHQRPYPGEIAGTARGVSRVSVYGDRLHIGLERKEDAAAVLGVLAREGIPVQDHREILPSLEDVFIAMVEK
jgi:hypothetical protein